MRQTYPTDLSAAAWHLIARLIPLPKHGGHPVKHSRREIVKAILYAVRTGCVWRQMPHDLPAYRIAYHDFRLWKQKGVWRRIHDRLRRTVRKVSGRQTQPWAAILDSQSVKTTDKGGLRGDDAAKNVVGRKRHILVDTLRLLLVVVVHAAHLQDRTAARRMLAPLATSSHRLRLV